MKKNGSGFPWYALYAPAIAILLILLWVDSMLGDGLMSFLKDFLMLLQIDDTMVVNLMIIIVGFCALVYVISRWLVTNKRLKEIGQVAETAPREIKEKIGSSETTICRKLDQNEKQFLRDISEIKSSSSAVQRQVENLTSYRPGVLLQQEQAVSALCSLYAQHDRDQETIAQLTKKVAELEEENAVLRESQSQYRDYSPEL